MTPQERFESLQARWRAAQEKAHSLRFDLRYHYGEHYYVYAPKGKRDKADRASRAEEKAADAIFAWLDANSPRDWRRGVPSAWVCGELTYADAMTTDQLSVVPPVAYGCTSADSIRFARAIAS